jgi:hypothetical protein
MRSAIKHKRTAIDHLNFHNPIVILKESLHHVLEGVIVILKDASSMTALCNTTKWTGSPPWLVFFTNQLLVKLAGENTSKGGADQMFNDLIFATWLSSRTYF